MEIHSPSISTNRSLKQNRYTDQARKSKLLNLTGKIAYFL